MIFNLAFYAGVSFSSSCSAIRPRQTISWLNFGKWWDGNVDSMSWAPSQKGCAAFGFHLNVGISRRWGVWVNCVSVISPLTFDLTRAWHVSNQMRVKWLGPDFWFDSHLPHASQNPLSYAGCRDNSTMYSAPSSSSPHCLSPRANFELVAVCFSGCCVHDLLHWAGFIYFIYTVCCKLGLSSAS